MTLSSARMLTLLPGQISTAFTHISRQELLRFYVNREERCQRRELKRLDELRPGEKSKSELITYVKDRAGHDRRYAIDAARIINELGWKPAYTFETGIEQTIHWYLENEARWERIRDGAYRDYYKKQYSV